MKMEHVTIQSACLDESVKFYKEIVNLTVQQEMRGKGPFDIVFLANESGGTCIELIDSPEAAYEGKGISIGFSVDDVEQYHKELEEKGLKPTPIISPNPHVKFFFVNDPNGVSIQFIE